MDRDAARLAEQEKYEKLWDLIGPILKLSSEMRHVACFGGKRQNFFYGQQMYACESVARALIEPTVIGNSFAVCCLARPLLESSYNLVFYVRFPDELDRAIRHALQRIVRHQERTTQIGDISWTYRREPGIRVCPDMQQMIDEFTSNRDRPKNWSDASLIGRVEKLRPHVAKRYVSLFALTHTLLYEDASEVIHGTPFGAMFARGLDGSEGNLLKAFETDPDRKKYQMKLSDHFFNFAVSLYALTMAEVCKWTGDSSRENIFYETADKIDLHMAHLLSESSEENQD